MLELITIVNCIECQYLHMPNPEEDIYICLKSLKIILHELDDPICCTEFEEVLSFWIPIYDREYQAYL